MLSPARTKQHRGWQRDAAKKRIGKPLTWACPRCGAPANEFCITKRGIEMTQLSSVHNARLTPGKKPSKSYRAWA
jgi:hypothetical protein